MAFICGENDTERRHDRREPEECRSRRGPARTDFEFTGVKEIPKTKLAGAKLLDPGLGTEACIIDTSSTPVMPKRGKKRRTERKVETSRFFYTRAQRRRSSS